MSDAPERWKKREDYTVDEELAAQQAERRGETFQVETPEYRKARAEHLRAGGFAEDSPEPKPIEEMSVDEVYRDHVRHG
jgi:hypothetical protein